ncbi:MAG: hypothetical protein RBS77_03855 [Candidatus Moranbacteria bacterium]|jgi:hypothetical protein|nr:hypothetical protein [Candidatus Moranbacteria bacterium]
MAKLSEWSKSHPLLMEFGEERLIKLENLKNQYNITDADFALSILGSPAFTLKIQESEYKKLKKLYPNATEPEILKIMIGTRYFDKSEKEIDLIMSVVYSFESLCNYVIKQDEIDTPYHVPGIANKLIDEIINS